MNEEEYKEKPDWAKGDKYFNYCPHKNIPGSKDTCFACVKGRIKAQKKYDIAKNIKT